MKQCTVEGCKKVIQARRMCPAHYQWNRKRGNFSDIKPREMHGLRRTPEYHIWGDLRQRCYNPNRREYPRYGGRGIKVCDRWLESFGSFYKDMGPRPTSKHSIDREDNSGDYTPENCRWATDVEQARNRGNFNVVYKGEYAIDASIRLGGSRNMIATRLMHGWSLERAFTTPIAPRFAKIA